MFGRDPIFQSRHQPLAEQDLDLDATTAQLQVFLSERGQLFRRVMPLAFHNLVIAQQRDRERYQVEVAGITQKPTFNPGTTCS